VWEPVAGAVVELKKAHVCGSDRFAVTQVGLDIRLSCAGCGARVVLTRQRLASRLRAVIGEISAAAAPPPDADSCSPAEGGH
jgi:hypothetical protein